jgi:hypothetical protein
MTNTPARELIWVPILHTQADLGSASELLKSLGTERLGRREWERHIESISDMWRQFRIRIMELDLNYGKLRLYQDGLANCGRECEIVKDLAGAGSQNHQILMDLMERGATLTGTESPDLLLKEYNLAQEILQSLQPGGSDAVSRAQRGRRAALLKERDRYIARRIDETLRPDETGLVFLGLLHSLEDELPEDIRLVSLERAARARSKSRSGRPNAEDGEA